MRKIESRHNAVVAEYKAAARGEEPSVLLLDGAHLVSEALSSSVIVHHAVVAANLLERPELSTLVSSLERQHIETVAASPAVMAAISPVHSPSSIVALAHRSDISEAAIYTGAPGLVVIACGIQDPGNIGAV